MIDIKTLRVLFLSSTSGRSGTYTRSFFLGKYLVRMGHHVSLILSSDRASYHASRKIVQGMEIYLLPLMDTSRLLIASLYKLSTTLTQTLFNCLLETTTSFDLLHSFDIVGPQNAAPTLLCRFLRFLRLHDKVIFTDWDEWWGRGGIYGLMGYPWMVELSSDLVTFLEEKMPFYSDGLTVSSEGLEQRALSVGIKSQNAFLIPNGADVDSICQIDREEARKKLNLPIESVIYSHFGFFGFQDLKLLLRAHKKVVSEFPSAFLLLGALPPNYEAYVESIMPRNVLCVARQPYFEYSLYLGASDVLLLPMQDNIFDRSRSPLRLGDYLAAGRPIVASDLPQIKNVTEGCSSLARPNDPEDFAGKIIEIIKNSDKSLEMGNNARQLAESEFSWQIFAKRLEKAYDRYL